MNKFFDCEVYKDYFLASFSNGKTTVDFEMYEGKSLDRNRLRRAMESGLTGGFNSINYDNLIVAAALSGYTCGELKELSDKIIQSNKPSWMVAKEENINVPMNWDHIDIINVLAGVARLKIYAARIGQPKLQDLPYKHDELIATPERRKVVRKYCHNDVRDTKALFDCLKEQLALRVTMSNEYDIDMRSKSDAQIAEAIMRDKMGDALGRTVKPTQIPDNYKFAYKDPKVISFKSLALKSLLVRIYGTTFRLSKNKSVENPRWLAKGIVPINKGRYSIGIGGIHSCEKSQTVVAGDTHLLWDFDVASFYPAIILQQGLFPKSLGPEFLSVFRKIVDERLAAKASGQKAIADTLKIVINGTYGKLGSKYSVVYSPDLLAQTTLTGQLALLMMIERIEAIGDDVNVVSANTDGIVIHAPVARGPEIMKVKAQWEKDTTYVLERTDYSALYSRDVNNYIAVKTNGDVKRKGAFGLPTLTKNPAYPILANAVVEYLTKGKPLETTIWECRDPKQFVMVRTVNKGGAVWRDHHLGGAVRFYKSSIVPQDEAIRYASDGHKVPTSDGCRPLMDLPSDGHFMADVNYAWYLAEAKDMLKGLGPNA